MTKAKPQVLIIGAGICGLALAQGLKKASITFKIFEAEEDRAFRPREWTMAIHWSMPMLRSLLPDELAAKIIPDASVDPSLDYGSHPNNVMNVYDGVSGEVLTQISVEGELIRVSRRKLRELCKQGIPVQYGHSLREITYSPDGSTVTASFANGTTHTGTLLIGTDGPRSKVRETLFGPALGAASSFDIVYFNVTFKYPTAEQALHVRSAGSVLSSAVHPAMTTLVTVQDVPDPEKPETWRFQAMTSWRGSLEKGLSNGEKHRIVKEKAKGLAEPFRSALEWMPENVDLQTNYLAGWITQPWDSRAGRVALGGDAAHCMPPNRGQGLNHALNDALNFVAAAKKIFLEKADRKEVVDAFNAELVERGSAEVKLSIETAQLTNDYSHFMDSALIKHGLSRSPNAVA